MRQILKFMAVLLIVGGLGHGLAAQPTQDSAKYPQARPAPKPRPTPIPVEGKLPQGVYSGGDQPGSYFHWTAEEWTADEKPFVEIRKSIDRQLSQTKSPRNLLQSYRRAALAKPLDARAQFRWAYTAFAIYKNRWETGKDERDVLKGVREAMEQPKSTKSYEYTRVRLFINQWDNDWRIRAMRHLEKCAFRMLKRNPDDDYVKYTFAFDLSLTSNKVPEQEIAYGWTKEYLAKYPDQPQAIYLMGFILASRFSRFQSMKLAEEARGYLKKCQAMLPADHFYQQKIKTQFHRIDQGIEIFRRVGKLKD